MCTVRWRTEARPAAWVTLLLLASASTQARATVPEPASPPAAAGSASVDREGCKEPLCYTASSLQADRNRMVLHDIHIVDTTRGITRITADQADANGQDLGNSEWVLTGHVQVDMPQGKLSADRATVQFVNKRIASMSAQGAPAQFEHSAAASGPDGATGEAGDAGNRAHGAIESARGHAREIDYDMEHELLKLNGDSWLSDGCNEINSQSIVYDIANQKVRADAAPGGDTQVHGTLHARTGPQCGSAVSRP
jgi:lipopolysaccharide export system protein LptA